MIHIPVGWWIVIILAFSSLFCLGLLWMEMCHFCKPHPDDCHCEECDREREL